MPIEVVKALGVKSLKSTKQVLTGYAGDAIPLLSRIELEYRGISSMYAIN